MAEAQGVITTIRNATEQGWILGELSSLKKARIQAQDWARRFKRQRGTAGGDQDRSAAFGRTKNTMQTDTLSIISDQHRNNKFALFTLHQFFLICMGYQH